MRWPLFLLLLLAVPVALAEMSGYLELGARKEFETGKGTISIAFVGYTPETGRALFLLNDLPVNLLPLQRKNVSGLGLSFLGTRGTAYRAFEAGFTIDGYVPIVCEVECVENAAVSFVQNFDPSFQLCKDNCNKGCGLYTSRVCTAGELLEKDACGNVTRSATCQPFCASCADCGKSCTGSFCSFCPSRPFCVSSDDCAEGETCVSGSCTKCACRAGDGVCPPAEPCSSPDCSCGPSSLTPRKDSYPIVLIHGFASSPAKLKKLQRELAFDLGYVNGGTLDASTLECPTLANRTVYLATYYRNGQQIQSQDRISFILKKLFPGQGLKPSESTFVDHLGQVVARVKACAGTDKVNIVAHSMGGAVAMGYLLEDDHSRSINKIILLGAPMKGGIYGEQTYQLFKGIRAELGERRVLLKECSTIGVPSLLLTLIDGRGIIGDCQELQRAGSGAQLGTDETPGLVQYYTISGKIDDIGDGIVAINSTQLQGTVRSSVVPCYHLDLKDPVKCDAAYVELVKDLGYTENDLRKQTFFDKTKELWLSIWDGITIIFE